MSERVKVSSEGLITGGPASKLTCMVIGRIHFLRAVGIMASATCWLCEDYPQVLSIRTSLTWQLASSKPAKANFLARQKSEISCDPITAVKALQHWHISVVRSKLLKGGTYIIPGGRNHLERMKTLTSSPRWIQHICVLFQIFSTPTSYAS